MLGIPTLKELEKHPICPQCDKLQYEGLVEQAKGSPGFCLVDQVREGIPVKEMLKSRRTRRSPPSRRGG